MKFKKIKVLAATLCLAMALTACVSTNINTGGLKDSDPVTVGQTADYLMTAAKDYNKDVSRKEITKSLEEAKKPTRLEMLAMVSRAFGELPEAKGHSKKVSQENVDTSTVPEWAENEVANLVKGGILTNEDLGVKDRESQNSEAADADLQLPDTGKPMPEGGSAAAAGLDGGTLAPDAPEETSDISSDDGFALAGPDDGAPSEKPQNSQVPQENSNITLKDVKILVNRIYALYGTDEKDDFYAFVNKQDLDNMEIPEGKTSAGGSSTVEAETDQRINEIIREIVTSGKEYPAGSNEQKILDFYKSMMDSDSRNTQSAAPLKPYFEKIDGATTLEQLQTVQAEIVKALGLSNNGLISFSVSNDLTEPSKKVLSLNTGFMRMMREDYENKNGEMYQGQKKAIADQLVFAGETREAAEQAAQRILAAEYDQLVNGMSEEEAADLSNYNNTITMEQLDKMAPEMDITKFFGDIGFKSDMLLHSNDPKGFEGLAKKLTQENIDTLKAQMKLTLLSSNAEFLGDAVKKLFQDQFGGDQDTTEEQKAFDAVSTYLSNELGQIYVKRYFPEEAKQDVENMVAQMVDAFRQRIKKLDWMNEKTKAEALRKLDTLKVYIGYPDEWPKSSAQIKSPEDGGSYFENITAIERERLEQSVAQQDKSSGDSFGLAAYMVNAAANRQANTLVFPAGILQAPFYDKDASFEENLGGIGVIIAHEITHVFDDQGAQYDSNGALKNWWTDSDQAHFKSLCSKAVDFYDGWETAPGIAVSGKTTLSENIADIGGVACALEILANKKDADYDKFFKNYAKSWVLVTDRGHLKMMAASDEHAPKKLRVNKVVSNFEEFFKTYNIEEGDGMYVAPEDRIQIW